MSLETRDMVVPAHVPADRVFHFDIFNDPRLKTDLHAGYATLYAEAPDTFFTPENGGHWVVTRHAAIFEVLRHYEVFSNKNLQIPKVDFNPPMIPITLDPPEHSSYRRVLMKIFAPKPMQALEAHIREWAGKLIDALDDSRECDFVQEISGPLPVSVFMQMMGLPLDRFEELRGWVMESFEAQTTEGRIGVYIRIVGYMTGLIQDRMAERQDDIISHLLDSEIDGHPITLEEMQSICLMLFIAGLDTVTNAMSFGARHLALYPDLHDRLREDPSAIPEVIEEFLRRYAFTNTTRLVVKDTEIAGAPMKAGDMVFCTLSLAGLDDRVTADPMTFDADRASKDHLTFSSGPHRCVGSHLARLELRILFEEWTRRIKTSTLVAGNPPQFRAGIVMAVERLPLNFEKT